MEKTNKLITSVEDKANIKLILDLRADHPRSFARMLVSKKYRYLYDWLNLKTPLLQNGNYTITTKLYWVLNGLTDFPLCGFCHHEKLTGNVDFLDKGYFRACSTACPGMKAARQQKYIKTCEKNWGSSNFFSSDAGKKIKEDWCKEHGVDNPFQLESVKDKSRQSRKNNFGCEYTMQSAEKRKLASDNYMSKTGFKHQFANPGVISKSKESKEHRKSAGDDIYAKRRTTNRKLRYKGFCDNAEIMPLFTKDEFIALDNKTQYTTPLKWKCRGCGTEFTALIDQNWSSRKHVPVRCLKCHPLDTDIGKSEAEEELHDFCRSVVLDGIMENDRKLIAPFELDVIVEKHKIAIEFDGLYWHSESAGGKPSQYHLAKTRMCEERGYQLIHVFSDEWRDKADIVKSRLKNLFGVYDRTVYARLCEVCEVNSVEARIFLDANHIQGAVNASARFGLRYNGELIALMTFGKCRFDKKHEWEMLRFCSKLGYHIPGAAGRLLKHFERECRPSSLISYADRRWSNGKLYKALGFELMRESPPDYWYLPKGCSEKLSRLQFQKHKLPSVLSVFDASKTEVENMRMNGYDRIFDCGNLVFSKTYS